MFIINIITQDSDFVRKLLETADSILAKDKE